MDSAVSLDVLDESTARRLEHAAKLLIDLDQLVELVRQSLPLAKPWQRHLVDQLANAQRHLQVLRMTVSMRRHDSEILSAAAAARLACRQACVAAAASRADLTKKASLRLIADMATKVESALRESFETATGGAPEVARDLMRVQAETRHRGAVERAH